MSEVFLSYKREDELRVARLVLALRKHGLVVWWDRGLPAGEPWRANIEAALAQARCAVVVWTQASTGEEGGFVRDEAARAARRNILVPVMFDRVAPPVGFGELQAIDLTHWRGRASDPFLLDLVAALRAKMESRPVPPARGPMRRLRRRLGLGGAASAAMVMAAAFATNTLNLQNSACGTALAQPAISDACAALGLGARPTRAERIAWAQRPAGDCDAVRRHLQQFPQGALRGVARDVLDARTTTDVVSWVRADKPRPLDMVVGKEAGVQPAVNVLAARAAALDRGRLKAGGKCEHLVASGMFRLVRADVEATAWSCEAVAGGWACGFEGLALCTVDERSQHETESCGAAPPGH